MSGASWTGQDGRRCVDIQLALSGSRALMYATFSCETNSRLFPRDIPIVATPARNADAIENHRPREILLAPVQAGQLSRNYQIAATDDEGIVLIHDLFQGA